MNNAQSLQMPVWIFQISIQCKENSEGRDGMVLFDTEAFPMVNIYCPTSVEDLPEGQCKQQISADLPIGYSGTFWI